MGGPSRANIKIISRTPFLHVFFVFLKVKIEQKSFLMHTFAYYNILKSYYTDWKALL